MELLVIAILFAFVMTAVVLPLLITVWAKCEVAYYKATHQYEKIER